PAPTRSAACSSAGSSSKAAPERPSSASRPKGRGWFVAVNPLPFAGGEGEGWGGVLSARPGDASPPPPSQKHPLPTSPLSAARPKGRGWFVAKGEGLVCGQWGGAGLRPPGRGAGTPAFSQTAGGSTGEGCFPRRPAAPPPPPLP